MVCAPALRVDVVNIAMPALTSELPITVLPSLNVIVPVGVPALRNPGAIVVVNVTAWFRFDGFTELLVASNVPRVLKRLVTVLLPTLATDRSGAPSPLISATAIDMGAVPTWYITGAWNVPSALPKRTAVQARPSSATARSRIPSPFTSTAAMYSGTEAAARA